MNSLNRLKIRYLAACMLATVVACGSPAAVADPVFEIDVPGGLWCLFGLHVEGFNGNTHDREFFDKNGNLVRSLTGGKGFDLVFENADSGATLSLKGNGTVARRAYNPDGSYTEVDTGHTVLILFPTDVPAGPSTTLYVGRVVFTVDTNGVFTLHEASGQSTDICAALSG
jgi:hypothetical protein